MGSIQLTSACELLIMYLRTIPCNPARGLARKSYHFWPLHADQQIHKFAKIRFPLLDNCCRGHAQL